MGGATASPDDFGIRFPGGPLDLRVELFGQLDIAKVQVTSCGYFVEVRLACSFEVVDQGSNGRWIMSCFLNDGDCAIPRISRAYPDMKYPRQISMTSKELQTLLRERLREQRERIGLTKEGLADRARAAGLPWSHHTVWAIESGRRNVTLGEALLLQVFLNTTLDRLLRTDSEVVDVDGVPIKGNALRALARPTRRPVNPFANTAPMAKSTSRKQERDLDRIASKYRLDVRALMKARAWAAASAEKKAAHTLRISPIEVSAAAQSLWSRSLTEEREGRLKDLSRHDGPGVHLDSDARSGHVTRALVAELRAHLHGRRSR